MPLVEPEFEHPVQRCAHRTVDFRSRILVMAVVNRRRSQRGHHPLPGDHPPSRGPRRLGIPGDGAHWGTVPTSTTERDAR